MDDTMHARSSQSQSSWTALRHPTFRAVWIATVASNLGTWMQDVGNVWEMTRLSSSPLLVSLVQTAGSLPLFALALPAGVLADIVDRRRILIFAQLWMCGVAVLIGLIALFGMTSPAVLLVFATLLGSGAALAAPAFQSVVPELVPREDLPSAVGLNALAVNLSRSVGPAVGGIVVATAGPAAAFFLNGLSFVLVASVFLRWQYTRPASPLPAERFFAGMRAGLRFVRHHPPLRAVLVRNFLFMAGASALWSLMPVTVRTQVQLGPLEYGLLLGFMGVGAVIAITVLPHLKRWLSDDKLIVVATVCFACATLALTLCHTFWSLAPGLFIGGMGWVLALGTLNAAAQQTVPAWVRSRAIAVYLLVWYGTMAFGGVIWGTLAQFAGPSHALLVASCVLLFGLVGTVKWNIARSVSLDLAPAVAWSHLADVSPATAAAVVVQIEYEVSPENESEFIRLATELRESRLRTGAFAWSLYRDAQNPRHVVEQFVVESWEQHRLQHERQLVIDEVIHKQVSQLALPGSRRVRHLTAIEESPERRAPHNVPWRSLVSS
jgi:MFS family permease